MQSADRGKFSAVSIQICKKDETINSCFRYFRKLKVVAGGEVIGHMDTMETGGFHSDEKVFGLGIIVQDSKDHDFHFLDTVYGVRSVKCTSKTMI